MIQSRIVSGPRVTGPGPGFPKKASMKRVRSLCFCAGAFTAVAAVGLLSGCAQSPAESSEAATEKTPTVSVATAMRRDLSRNLTLTAEFRPYQEVDLHAKVAGYVKTITVDIGDRVKQGQLLATLEVPEIQDELKQAEASVRQSHAELTRAQNDEEQAESAHEVAHLAYTRLGAVIKQRPNLVAQQEIDDAMGRDHVSEARVSAAKAAVIAAQERLEVARANRSRLRTLVAYSQISAPFSGVITKRYADPGAMIQAGTSSQTQTMPVVRLSENSRLRLIVPVPESAVPRIKLGAPVEVHVPSLHKKIEGKVTRFAGTLDLQTRTMETEIDVANPRLELVPGMYAEASITLERKDKVLTVPVQALDHHDGKSEVYRVNAEGRIEVLPVVTGLEDPSQVEIVQGLKENDKVIVSGRGQLRANEKVLPKDSEPRTSAGES